MGHKTAEQRCDKIHCHGGHDAQPCGESVLTTGTVMYEVFIYIGYFTAPVMCYFLVEGCRYTRSKLKYG